MAGDVRWHINPETGKPGRCSAKKQCRFGLDGDEHHESFDAAQKAYEKQREEDTFSTIDKDSLASNSLEESPALEEPVPAEEEFTRKIPAGESLGDYVEPGDYIKYHYDIIKVKAFEYDSIMLRYEVEGEDGTTTYIPDYDWYEKSTISIVDKRPPADPETFETPLSPHKLQPRQRFTTDDSDTVYTVIKTEAAEYSYDPHTKVYVEEQEQPIEIYWYEKDGPTSEWDPPRPMSALVQE